MILWEFVINENKNPPLKNRAKPNRTYKQQPQQDTKQIRTILLPLINFTTYFNNYIYYMSRKGIK